MKGEEEKRERLRGIWSALGKYKYVLIVILAGVILLALPRGNEGASSRKDAAGSAAEESFDLDGLERSMEQALSRIEGAGDVTVVLTLRGGTRRVLAEDSQISETQTSRETVVVSKGSSVEEGLLLQEIYPQFRGALVVCSGGNDASVRLKVLEAVSALTGLGSDCISICAGNGVF